MSKTNVFADKNFSVSLYGLPNPNYSFEFEFNNFKKSVTRYLSQLYIVDQEVIENIKHLENKNEYDHYMWDYINKATDNQKAEFFKDSGKGLYNLFKGYAKPELRKTLVKRYALMGDNLTDLYKSVIKSDKNSNILIIKQIFDDKYKIANTYFNNNIYAAELCLAGCNELSKYGLELPDQIICSPYIHNPEVSMLTSKGKTIVINPNIEIPSGYLSTDNECHVFVHAGIHCNQPALAGYNFEHLPEKFNEILSGLSKYALSQNYYHEVDAELRAKQILEGLTPEEEELLKYIEDINHV